MRVPAILLAALALGAAAPGVAGAAYVPIKGAPAEGPSKYDRVWVEKFGPASAKKVLVLVPGYLGGSGDFSLIGPEIVSRVPGLQVWALDRRESVFEDTSVLRAGDPDAAFRYYLNLEPIGGRYFKQINGAEVPFARSWGLETSLEDLRRVVLRARDGGRRTVILGGHSLGASTTAAYATWDFDGHPGYEDIAGMVLIDGGMLGTFATPSKAEVLRRLRALRTANPFVALLDGLPPWAAGAFAETAALFALKQPDAPAVLQTYPLLPKSLVPPVRVTNLAIFGNAFDVDTSPSFLEVVHVNAGGLAATGDPRGWADGGLTPVSRLVAAFAHEPGNFVDWYFPARLTLDVDAANSLRRDAVTRAMHLRTWHLAAVDRPLYAFETALTGGRVLRGARRFAAASKVGRPTLVADHAQQHIDPLLAAPERNRFLQTVVPFLRKVKTGH